MGSKTHFINHKLIIQCQKNKHSKYWVIKQTFF